LNVPEQLEFSTDAILVGEPNIPRAPSLRPAHGLDITPSDLLALNGCFRYFNWTRMLGISEPGTGQSDDSPQMRLGSTAHKIMESETRPSLDALSVAGLPDLAAVFESSDWREMAAACPERELPFIMHLMVNGKDCWVHGRMDVAVGPDPQTGIPRVIDYKYSVWREGNEADYEIQMAAYALSLMKAMGTDHAVAELWYLKSPMKIIRRKYSLTEADEKLRGLLARYMGAIERNDWPVAERGYCDRVECGFRERCWSVT
jgi:CRISPR/Cas system-associated exonuclease Cas4 (RecB family)